MSWKSYSPVKKAAMIIMGTIAGIGMAFLFGLFIKLLWNGLMPKIFGLGLITYWQAVGLAILGRLIFGGFGSSGGSKNNKDSKKHQHDHRCIPMDDKMKDWEHYDKWWKEEGEKSFRDFAAKDKEPEAEEVTSD